ncbi:MAG TPA: aldo/keto reductase [Gaiellales bacterium]|jgi:2,5-diketo-D-gluconate reductase A|nr:aldo/keto reductase [Gaiellales bacterium]
MTTDQTIGQPAVELADGGLLPMLGLGVWQVPNEQACVDAVRWALELGYRHIDTAQAYGNEESVGEGLRRSGIPREDVYLTTKFYPAKSDPVTELEDSLRRLRVDAVDLYIIHWPQGGPTWAWKGMERARERGLTRSIGVSNFSAAELDELSAVAEVTPVVNQIQFNPFSNRSALVDACRRHGIVPEAYSPLGTGRHLSHPVVARIAERVGRTPAQVLLRWCIQLGLPVIPKSTHRERIEENGRIFDFELSPEDMEQLAALDETGGTDLAREEVWW